MLFRKKLISPRLRRRRRKALVLRLVFFLIAAVMFLGGLIWFTNLDFQKISNLSVEGNITLPLSEIKIAAESAAEEESFLFFPRTSFLFFPKNFIEQKIIKKFPRVESVSVRIISLTASVIKISERAPYGVWCGAEKDISRKCFFVDKTGLAFDEVLNYADSSFIEFKKEESAGNVLTGEYYIAKDKFADLSSFLEFLRSRGYEPVYVKVSENGGSKILLEDFGSILFNQKQKLADLEGSFDSIVREFNFSSGSNSGKGSTIDYIDFRFGNKVFLKKTSK